MHLRVSRHKLHVTAESAGTPFNLLRLYLFFLVLIIGHRWNWYHRLQMLISSSKFNFDPAFEFIMKINGDL